MARMPYGPLGPIIGKIGTIIGVRGKSGHYIKAVQRPKKDKPSPAQQMQRDRMAVVTSFLNSMRGLIAVTFYKKEDNRIPWNKAMSFNMKNALYTTGGKPALLYSATMISQGDLPNVFSAAASVVALDTIAFTWEDNSGVGNARGSDNAILVVYCEATNQCMYTTKGAARKAGTDSIRVPGFAGKTMHTWLAFASGAKEIAPSLYTGELDMPAGGEADG
jgi:hypothetical protein